MAGVHKVEVGRVYDEPERAEALQHLRELAKRRALTLLTAARRADISEATVLAELLRGVSR